MPENEGLKREIGLWGLVANSVNIMIGAGIFILPVLVADQLGGASISAYAICGGLMILIMLCFSEIGSKITITGGAYTYIETAYGRYAGFLATNVFIFGASVTANAAVSNGLADTLSYFIPIFGNRISRIIFFALIFGGLAYFNIRGVKNAVSIVKFNTVAKLLPLAMIVIAGWFFIDTSQVSITVPETLDDVGKVAVLLMFAFTGAETALNVGGEIKKPEKTIPQGVLISMFFVLVLYMAIQVIVQTILGDSISNYREAPLAQTASVMFGTTGATIVVVGAVFSMFGNISGMVLNMPRVLYAAARDRVLPSKKLALIHPVFRTPHIAIVVYSIVGFLFASIGEFRQLAMLSSASYMIIYFGVAAAVVKFRITGQRQGNIFSGYVIPIISCLVILWVLSKLPLNELTGMIIFILIITVLYIPVRYIGNRQKKGV